MKTRMKILVVYVLSIGFMIAALAVSKEERAYDFKPDYEIDLRQDYILIRDEQGHVDTVQHGELENYLLKENL